MSFWAQEIILTIRTKFQKDLKLLHESICSDPFERPLGSEKPEGWLRESKPNFKSNTLQSNQQRRRASQMRREPWMAKRVQKTPWSQVCQEGKLRNGKSFWAQ
ncbi:hypothetical protein CH363_13755 [Leptospira haakeii]|uniref:Uncharacterized protein n=1 Tax=Leptospira haakeii TaxID=2023198 RepID=A0ABX4PI52_9LEPT|nr:hypothetical protein CH363_13755 [Leptospira haakeii]PKA18254.1 hypothetical protein CH377_18505 [Leptospira haakeii]